MSKAIEQSGTHKLSADKVFIATIYRKTRESTLNKIKNKGIGLIYIMPDESIVIEIDACSDNKPWLPAKRNLVKRILENG
jgi:hypothetical protein